MSEKNLYFFNKEGDYLNFNYNEFDQRFEGNILFHENSNDTYKTYGIYTLEKIDSFEYELPGQLTTDKFQLFNDYGIHFYSAKYATQSVLKVEPVNNDPDFYTKWVYGDDFDVKFPLGTLVKFNTPILEFINLNQTYVVVGSKKGAIMILSQMDNATFETSYYQIYLDEYGENFANITISGINAVGVYNYIKPDYSNNLSLWSEPDFYDKYYVGKKLNIVNTEKNDGILTVKNIDVTDTAHFEYYVDKTSLPNNANIIMEVITRTDVPKIYEGGVDMTSNNRIYVDPVIYPRILKSGTEFKVIGSMNNTNFFTVASIPDFNYITTTTYHATQSHVLYNNKIYQCIQGYTQSYGGSINTAYTTPENTDYWGNPDHIKVNESITPETLLFGQIYLTTDRYYFDFGWTGSNAITLASVVQKYQSDLSIFNIDLYYKDNQLKADLVYPSKYSTVNFYHTQLGSTYSIGQVLETRERLVEVEETLNYEFNYDYSENIKYNIVFTDLDEYGFKVTINGMVYDEEVAFVYSGAFIDMERTIDRTLRNWLTRYYVQLYTLGINAEIKYIGNYTSIFYNSIVLISEYPNVPMILNSVQVGSTANFYIENSRVLFNDLGPYLNIKINNDDYGVSTVYGASAIPNITATLQSWSDTHAETLIPFDIIVTNINNLLKFDVISLERRLEYTINTGKINLPGIDDYMITDKMLGNHGALIASNKILLPDTSGASFEEAGFSTGMALAINNTFHPYVNQEYVVQFLDPLVMDLSYQGPFWGLTDSICNSSAFITLAFNTGFGQTACSGPIGPTGFGGEFDSVPYGGFNPVMFSVTYNPNSYVLNGFDFSSYPGSDNLVDIKYIQLSSSILAYGDGLIAIDSYFGDYITTVDLPGNTQSIEMEFNTINNYVYCLSKHNIYVVDSMINTLVGSMSLSGTASDMAINPVNGDVYISYETEPKVDIFSYNNLTSIPNYVINSSKTNFPINVNRTGKMVFNDFEGDMYITTDSDYVIRVNSNRSIQTTYGILGLTHSIFYEPVEEAVYVYGSASLWKIDNGITQSIAISTYGFSDIIYNNISGEMNISDSSGNFTRLDLDANISSQTYLSGEYGYLTVNQFDGDVYRTNLVSPGIKVFDSNTGAVKPTGLPVLSAIATKIIYNPERKSIWAIQPSINSVVEILVTLNGSINLISGSSSIVSDNLYGTLDPNYVPKDDIWLKTREYFRRPRENFQDSSIPVKYYWRWLSDEVSDFFIYDFSGDQLATTGSYAYTGPKPLTNVVLNKLPNKDITKVSHPEYQQTIFNKIDFTLSYIDDETDISTAAEPLELFLGFKSENEGALRSVLQLYKSEEIQFDITSDSTTVLSFDTINDNDKRGIITINTNSSQTFTNKGLKPGQHIVIYVKDDTNYKNQYISENNGIVLKIREVYTKILIVDFFNVSYDVLEKESTVISNYPSSGNTTYLKTTIKVKDREIGRFITYGQTEEEDIRFKVELGNIGKLISPDEVFIFKEYDINEGGIDWIFLNKKRKEMLMNKDVIYSYIGSYKSLINAINYFGYNDLQLNEYYRNIDAKSREFGKLFKVEIPDIFDNTIKGWNENDFLKKDLPNENFEETNLFNLTYFITDIEGNYILNYSLDEIIIKLQGLKYWLKKNIIPLTHKILDITGRAFLKSGTQIQHNLYDIRMFNMREEMTPVTFKMNESYLYPVNSGSTVYNCVLDFYSIIPGSSLPIKLYVDNPKPYNDANLTPPDYFNVKIRTYKTYKEWVPFTTYNIGDKVLYYNNLYESVINNNKIKNPRKYDNISTWSANIVYRVSDVVEYNRDFYVYSGLGAGVGALVTSGEPTTDTLNWLKVTEWKKIDLEPVQTINEFRSGDDLLPYNFTIDSNIDPFIVIEVTSDNSYGQAYTDKKSYLIKGLKDLTDEYSYIDPIGPFQAITPVY